MRKLKHGLIFSENLRVFQRKMSTNLEKFFQIRESPTILIMLGLFLSMLLLNPTFFRARNLLGITVAAAMEIPAVIGMLALLATGSFDLSVGSVAALSSIVTGFLLLATGNILVSILGGFGVGLCFGLINGFFVTKLKINPLIVTLATMSIARAIALGLVEGRVLTGYPRSFGFIGQGMIYSVPVSVWIAAILSVGADFTFRKVRFYRRFFYVGSNEQATVYCGINTSQVILAAFVIVGLGASFAGILITSRIMASSPILYPGLALEIIAACIIGGASIRGGEGSIMGAVMGLFIIIIIRNMLVLLNISVYWKELVVGLILLMAVTVDFLSTSREIKFPSRLRSMFSKRRILNASGNKGDKNN